jgi:predicted small lipoprotein YifL
MKRFLLLVAVSIALGACGTKSDLTPPDNKPAPADTQDPSKPPHPLGH